MFLNGLSMYQVGLWFGLIVGLVVIGCPFAAQKRSPGGVPLKCDGLQLMLHSAFLGTKAVALKP